MGLFRIVTVSQEYAAASSGQQALLATSVQNKMQSNKLLASNLSLISYVWGYENINVAPDMSMSGLISIFGTNAESSPSPAVSPSVQFFIVSTPREY